MFSFNHALFCYEANGAVDDRVIWKGRGFSTTLALHLYENIHINTETAVLNKQLPSLYLKTSGINGSKYVISCTQKGYATGV
jgi:hypothetical protein